MIWQAKCLNCSYQLRPGLTRKQAEFYAGLHKAFTGHNLLTCGTKKDKPSKGVSAVGKAI